MLLEDEDKTGPTYTYTTTGRRKLEFMSVRRRMRRILLDDYPFVKQQYLIRAKQGNTKGFASKAMLLTSLHVRRLTGQLPPRPKPCIQESHKYPHPSPQSLAEQLMKYDLISFDVFDTLLFRPFSDPVELFYLVGEQLGYLNFAALREQMEREAREEQLRRTGSAEVTLAEIYQYIELHCGIPAELGLTKELDTERALLYPNPYMQEVLRLLPRDKEIIAISDSYFSGEFLAELFRRHGLDRIGPIFSSCDYRRGKADGALFEEARKGCGRSKAWVHVGDNMGSDIKAPRKLGIHAIHYPNVNQLGNRHRPTTQSAVIGGAYRGIVNARFHNGMESYSPCYEYGYAVGGIFVLGYCQFIHHYAQVKGIERLLFLSRDGDILKQVYDSLYPGSDTKYVYWSRLAAAKLGAGYFKYDYFRRFIDHETDRGWEIGRILHAMDLDPLAQRIAQESGLRLNEPLTRNNKKRLAQSLFNNWEQILLEYAPQRNAAKQYFVQMLNGCRSACTVDIGWAGSGGVILSHLVEREWNIPCKIWGLIAGSNSMYSEEIHATESLIASGKVGAYLYSQGMNRDLWASHNPDQRHNLWFEMLLASPTPGFVGFARGVKSGDSLRFDDFPSANTDRIKDIQKGISQFIRDYKDRFDRFPFMLDISGSDAYAPFRTVVNSSKYFNVLTRGFDFDEGVLARNLPIEKSSLFGEIL